MSAGSGRREDRAISGAAAGPSLAVDLNGVRFPTPVLAASGCFNSGREMGALVEHALCVIDRGEGGAEALAKGGIALGALFTRQELDHA